MGAWRKRQAKALTAVLTLFCGHQNIKVIELLRLLSEKCAMSESNLNWIEIKLKLPAVESTSWVNYAKHLYDPYASSKKKAPFATCFLVFSRNAICVFLAIIFNAHFNWHKYTLPLNTGQTTNAYKLPTHTISPTNTLTHVYAFPFVCQRLPLKFKSQQLLLMVESDFCKCTQIDAQFVQCPLATITTKPNVNC